MQLVQVNFTQRIKEILQYFKEQIKQTLSNEEIFHIFENNKLIILFLLKNGIINISDSIYDSMISKIESNDNCYCHFFFPELEKFKGEENMKYIEKDLLSDYPTVFENFEEKRQEGENDSYVCTLIRNDSVEEFVAYINLYNISFSGHITSIFETTFIEYAAFFGSIQIFKYLHMNDVKLTQSLLLYSIHSQNVELFNYIESNNENNK